MGKHIVIGKAPPMAAALAMILAYDRRDIEAAIEEMIARLDARDGDPDIEANGDELDGTGGEDDFCHHNHAGPGCPISDPGSGYDEDTEASLGALEDGPAGTLWAYAIAHTDEDECEQGDDPSDLRAHRNYIRRTRCDSLPYDRYRLREATR